ncbi:MAG: sugar phosphate isomerase/epimerase family protein [Thermoguttaceae bacterium]
MTMYVCRKFATYFVALLLFAGAQINDIPAAETLKTCSTFPLGLASYTLRKFDIDNTLAMCKRAGLTHICIKDFHLPLTATDEECAAFAKKCRDQGIIPHGVGPITLNTEQDIDNVLRYAKACGVKLIVAVPKPEILSLLDEKLKGTDFIIAIHNHGPEDKKYATPDDIMEKIETLSPQIGLCLDVGHTERAAKDAVDAIKKYPNRVHDIHWKDISKKEAKGTTVICGRGVLDLPAYLAELEKIGYTGVLAFEYEADADDPLPGLMESIGYTRGIQKMMPK